MSDDRRAQLKRLLESDQRQLHSLTLPQRELWEASRVPPQDVSNHICAFIEVQGKIAEKDCLAAVQAVVNRQEALRLSFLPAKGGAVQMIRPGGTPMVTFRDLSPSERHPDAMEALMHQVFSEPFDLTRGPLYRIVVMRRGPDELRLVFAIHHAIADGWSLGVFVQDLAAAYLQSLRGGRRPLPPVPLSYTAWGAAERAYWQKSEIEARAPFWRSLLKEAPRIWNVSGDPAPHAYTLRRWVSHVPAAPARAVRDLARRTGTTLFSTLLSAFQIAFACWNGSRDFVVGTPVANRHKQAARETMGYFAGNVPLRLQLDPQQSFAQAHQALHQNTLDAFSHAMPFVELIKVVNDLPTPERHPVYEIRFALQNHPVPDVAMPGLSLRLRMRSTGTARFSLGCEVTEEGAGLEVVWLYCDALFTASELKELDRRFLEVLISASRDPDTRMEAWMK